MSSAHTRLVAFSVFFVAFGLALGSTSAMAIEEPRYTLIEQDGDFSLRHYSAVIVAETQVAGTLDQASSTGFRRLAGYIFGDNHTSPVNHAENGSREPGVPEGKIKIAMTAPVTTQQQGPGWTINFTLPAMYSLRSLPLPDDPRVQILEKAEMTAAVIRFSGWVDAGKITTKTKLLRDWMAAHELVANDPARLARYNPPWTLPFWRRNEILIPCHKAR